MSLNAADSPGSCRKRERTRRRCPRRCVGAGHAAAARYDTAWIKPEETPRNGTLSTRGRILPSNPPHYLHGAVIHVCSVRSFLKLTSHVGIYTSRQMCWYLNAHSRNERIRTRINETKKYTPDGLRPRAPLTKRRPAPSGTRQFRQSTAANKAMMKANCAPTAI